MRIGRLKVKPIQRSVKEILLKSLKKHKRLGVRGIQWCIGIVEAVGMDHPAEGEHAIQKGQVSEEDEQGAIQAISREKCIDGTGRLFLQQRQGGAVFGKQPGKEITDDHEIQYKEQVEARFLITVQGIVRILVVQERKAHQQEEILQGIHEQPQQGRKGTAIKQANHRKHPFQS